MDDTLVRIDGQNHFITKRFDREGSEKLHVQTLAAMFPGRISYEDLQSVCNILKLPYEDRVECFRRMVFNHLSNNTDDHNKNFSFIMNRQGTWRLSPAYDITYIFDLGGFLPERHHCLFACGKSEGLTKQDVLNFAKIYGIRDAQKIINDVVLSLQQFRLLAEKYRIREELIGRIDHSLQQNIRNWGYDLGNHLMISYDESIGRHIENAHLELTEKGNIHLLAYVNGALRKYIFRHKTEANNILSKIGLSNVFESTLKMMVSDYILDVNYSNEGNRYLQSPSIFKKDDDLYYMLVTVGDSSISRPLSPEQYQRFILSKQKDAYKFVLAEEIFSDKNPVFECCEQKDLFIEQEESEEETKEEVQRESKGFRR